jgi:AraC-like DNA-binding protein
MPRGHVANSPEIKQWSTSDVDPTRRLDYFASALSEAIVPFGLSGGDSQDFQAELKSTRLDVLGLSKLKGAPHQSVRGASELARTRNHGFNLIMSLDVSWIAEQRARVQLQPFDMFIHDSDYPLHTEVRSAFVSINLEMPESWLRRWVASPGVLVAKRITGQSRWAASLAAYLSAMTPELVLAPPLPIPLIADQIGSLIALAASGMNGNSPPAQTAALRSLRERILDCMVQRCTESSLTAFDVSTSVNISLRTLHRTLAASNETFGQQLIEARYRVAERMLLSPLFKRVTTAEIGRRAGFLSPSHFARVVRTRSGRTPTELRRLSLEQRNDTHSNGSSESAQHSPDNWA